MATSENFDYFQMKPFDFVDEAKINTKCDCMASLTLDFDLIYFLQLSVCFIHSLSRYFIIEIFQRRAQWEI